jgi:hypothetical protein
MKTLLYALSIGVASLLSSGCGMYMAFTQPPKVDTQALEAGGLSRDMVIERLGAPRASTKNVDGSREDTYEYYEGSESGWKIGRGVFHLLADVFTLALWEVIATPTEYVIKGEKLTAQVNFDNTDRMTAFKVLGREGKPSEKNVVTTMKGENTGR